MKNDIQEEQEYVDPAQMGLAPGPNGQAAPEQTDNGLKEGDEAVPDDEQKPYTVEEEEGDA